MKGFKSWCCDILSTNVLPKITSIRLTANINVCPRRVGKPSFWSCNRGPSTPVQALQNHATKRPTWFSCHWRVWEWVIARRGKSFLGRRAHSLLFPALETSQIIFNCHVIINQGKRIMYVRKLWFNRPLRPISNDNQAKNRLVLRGRLWSTLQT